MIREIVTCTHEAMATGFSVQVAGWSRPKARQAALEAFAEVDRLERLLSRFLEGSDIDRINGAEPGVPVRVNADTFDCVFAAIGTAVLTEGAFDPTAGSIDPATMNEHDHWPDYRGILLDEDALTIMRTDSRLRLDLGGIGKGFAVDLALESLREWEVPAALVTAGGSTAAGFGTPGLGIWAGTIEAGHRHTEIDLGHLALASSGTAVKGQHIQRTAQRPASAGHIRTWAVAGNATLADALSTAFFMSTPEEIAKICSHGERLGAAWLAPDTEPHEPPATAGLLRDAVWC